MAKKTSTVAFNDHLETVRASRLRMDQVMATMETAHGQATRAIDITWQFLFDHLCRDSEKKKKKKLQVGELERLTAITYRLIQAMYRLGVLDQLTQGRHKLHVLSLVKQSGLPLELRDELERELNIMP